MVGKVEKKERNSFESVGEGFGLLTVFILRKKEREEKLSLLHGPWRRPRFYRRAMGIFMHVHSCIDIIVVS